MEQNSDSLTEYEAAIVKVLLICGFQHKRIASLFDVNQGRISEINSGKRFADVDPARLGIYWNGSYPIKKPNVSSRTRHG